MAKLIIINKNTQTELTFDEVYHKYQPLLKKIANQWMNTYEYDEIFQTAAIGLWKTYEKYDASYGIGFSALMKTMINNEVFMYCRKHRAKIAITSLNEPVNYDDELELIDTIGEDETFSSEIVDNLFFENLFKKLPKQHREYIYKTLDGYLQREIAENYQAQQSVISRKMQSAFNRLRVLYVKEVAL